MCSGRRPSVTVTPTSNALASTGTLPIVGASDIVLAPIGLTAQGQIPVTAASDIEFEPIRVSIVAYFGGQVYEPHEGLIADAPNYATLVATPSGFTGLVQDAARYTELTRPG